MMSISASDSAASADWRAVWRSRSLRAVRSPSVTTREDTAAMTKMMLIMMSTTTKAMPALARSTGMMGLVHQGVFQ